MKIIGKIFWGILFVAYVAVAICVTVLIMSYNEYNSTQLGEYTFILINNRDLEPEYNKGDLVLVKETRPQDINEGDSIFLYRAVTEAEYEIKYAKVLLKDDSLGDKNTKYILEGNAIIDYKDIVGGTKDIIVIPHLGTVLSVLESQLGYLFLIVVVSFVLLLYEMYELIIEIKYGDKEQEGEQ